MNYMKALQLVGQLCLLRNFSAKNRGVGMAALKAFSYDRSFKLMDKIL